MNKRIEFVFSQFKKKYDNIENKEWLTALQIKQVIISKKKPTHISFIECWKSRISEFKEEMCIRDSASGLFHVVKTKPPPQILGEPHRNGGRYHAENGNLHSVALQHLSLIHISFTHFIIPQVDVQLAPAFPADGKAGSVQTRWIWRERDVPYIIENNEYKTDTQR